MQGKIVVLFRAVAVAEALSWAGLLAGMFTRSVLGQGDGGVPVLGMVHGVLFVCYLLAALTVARLNRWDFPTLLLSGAAGVAPLGTWPFERWALRTGRLDDAAVRSRAGVGLYLRIA
ncbi:MAG: DUF3817 domain-containing protein [Thermocrispum sp.]